jgi:hypothetical protein
VPPQRPPQAFLAQQAPTTQFPVGYGTTLGYSAFPGSTAAAPPSFSAPSTFYGGPAGYDTPPPSGAVWDQSTHAHAFQTMSLTPPPTREWYMNTCADNHMTSNPGNLSSTQPTSSSTPTSIIVSNGSLLPITMMSLSLTRKISCNQDLYRVSLSK